RRSRRSSTRCGWSSGATRPTTRRRSDRPSVAAAMRCAVSAGADRDAAATAWLRRHRRAVRGWSTLASVGGMAASLAYAAFAAFVAGTAQAWIDGTAVPAWTPWFTLVAVLARGVCHALRDWAGARAAIVVRANARAEILDALERLGPLRARLGD